MTDVKELDALSELVDAVEAYHKAIYRTVIDPHTLNAAKAALESLSRDRAGRAGAGGVAEARGDTGSQLCRQVEAVP